MFAQSKAQLASKFHQVQPVVGRLFYGQQNLIIYVVRMKNFVITQQSKTSNVPTC